MGCQNEIGNCVWVWLSHKKCERQCNKGSESESVYVHELIKTKAKYFRLLFEQIQTE